MKKISKLILSFSLFLMISLIPIYAASGSASVSGPGEVYVGESISVTVTANANAPSSFELSIYASGAASGSYSWAPGSVGESKTFTFSTHSAGTAVIEVSGEGADWENFEPFSVYGSTSVSVVNKNTGGGDNGGNNGGNNGNTGGDTGGNTGGDNSGSNDYTEEKPVEKTPEEIAKEEEEKEKAEKEKAQKTPLIASIEFTSLSNKLEGELIKTINPTEDKWDYEYTLPKRVDKFALQVKGVDDGITLTFDAEHEFKDGEPESKTINLRAVKGDITQEYKVKVSRNTSKPIEVTHEGAKGTIMDDEVLDKYMSDLGFKRETFKNKSDQEVPFFTVGKSRIQMIVGEDKKANWFLINDKNEVTEGVTLMFDKDKKPLFVSNAPEEVGKQTLNGASYVEKTLVADEKLKSIDPEINWDQTYKAWDFSEGEELVYGQRPDQEKELLHVNAEKGINKVIVSFDKEESQVYKWWAFGATAVAIIVSGVFIRDLLMRKKSNKIEL